MSKLFLESWTKSGLKQLTCNDVVLQEGVSDPPSISSISRLLRGGARDPDGKKDYSIDGILGGKLPFLCLFFVCVNCIHLMDPKLNELVIL